MNMMLGNIFFLSTIIAVSSALNCTVCNGTGTTCTGSGVRECPAGNGLCGRVTFAQNGVQKVLQNCARIDHCVGSIDCNKDGFELGKRYPNATNCVVSCCEGDNCEPKDPLQCHNCQEKGETCKNSISCNHEDDRCLRINFKVGNTLMTDERCYKSAGCSNTSEICDIVKKSNPTAKDCEPTCCDKPNCNSDAESHSAIFTASNFLVCFSMLIVMLKF